MQCPSVTFVLVLCVGATALRSATEYDERGLLTKKLVAERENQALTEPFVGVRASDGIQPGLFPVKSTGCDTTPIVEAARAFLASLSQAQKLKTQYAVDDPEWRRWFNVDSGIYVRQGVSLREMTPAQQAAARNLMAATLSARGLKLTDAIRKTDHTLRELNQDDLQYDEELYFFTVMGLPSMTEPWGWQVDGHHLVINAFLLGDQIAMTPTFLGGEPVVTKSGKYSGNLVLQDQQNDGLAFMRSLTPAQQQAATLNEGKRSRDIQAEALKDNAVSTSRPTHTDGHLKGGKIGHLELRGLD